MQKRFMILIIIGVVTVCNLVSAGTLEDIQDLQPGEWYEIPHSSLYEADVYPNPLPAGTNNNKYGPAGIMNAWSGGVYDTKRDRLLIMGGGHGDYSGNEIYAFDMDTFTWSRIWGPSADDMIGCTEDYSVQDLYDGLIPGCAGGTSLCCNQSFDAYFDGNPSSRHTYNAITYLPEPIDAIWLNGGSQWELGGGYTSLWLFNFTNNQWEKRDFFPYDYQNHDSGVGYDNITGNVFCRSRYYIREYNFDDNSLIEKHRINGGWSAKSTADIDPIHRRMLFIGEISGICKLGLFDIDTGDFTLYDKEDLTGNTEILSATSPGFVYDPKIGKFVAWSGESDKQLASQDVYVIDPVTLNIEKRYPASTNTVIPPESAIRGTFGRFRYVPSLDVFVVVNSISENVYVYRLSDLSGDQPGYDSTESMGELRILPTRYSIGIEWDINSTVTKKDVNRNAETSVQYRKSGSSTWKDALGLMRVDEPTFGFNMVAGSIMYLAPGTSYEVRLNYNDPDGGNFIESGTVSTLQVPIKPSGPIYHVEVGVSGGDGSESSPYNIYEAIANAQAGDTFLLHAGEYTGFDRIYFTKSGTEDNYIVWQAAGDGDVLFTFPRMIISEDYNWFEDIKFMLRGNENYLIVSSDAGADGIVITKNIIIDDNSSGWGYLVYADKDSRNWYITDNIITGRLDPVTSSTFTGEGIVMGSEQNPFNAGHTIAYNRISNTADGISYPGGNCDIFGNDIFDVTDDAIEPDYSGPNVRIYDNRISMAKHNAISLQDFDNGMPWFIIGNQIISYEQNPLKIRQTSGHFASYHNTIVNYDDVWFDDYSSYQSRYALYGISKNNLFVSATDGKMWHFAYEVPNYKTDIDYNAFDWGGKSYPFTFDGTSYSDLSSYSAASGLDIHSVEVDKERCFDALQISGPIPASVPLQYLDLKSGCGAIDAGVVLPNINDGFLGSAPDIGAYESGAELPQYGPRGQTLSICNSGADKDSSNSIGIDELIAFIDGWKTGSISIAQVLEAIGEWKNGC